MISGIESIDLLTSKINRPRGSHKSDGYYVAYKPITFTCISFMFIEMKFVHYYSCVMFSIKSISICNY